MTMAVDNAIRVLRENCDLDEDMVHELAQRVASGEIERPVWSKNDGTITVKLIGDEGKVLGESSEEFIDLLETILKRINDGYPPHVEYSVDNGVPQLHANFDFCTPEADPTAMLARAKRSVERLTHTEALVLAQACQDHMHYGPSRQ